MKYTSRYQSVPMRKIFLFIVLVIIIGFGSFLNGHVMARDLPDDVFTRTNWYADNEVLSLEEKFNWPSKVYIVPFSKKNLSFDYVDIQEVYYYFSTRSQVGDIPFHYVVTSSGATYQGHSLGDEALISIDAANDAVIIGYLYNGTELELGIRAIPALKDILLDVINFYAISPENISVRKLDYSIGDKGRVESLALGSATKAISNEFSALIASLEEDYSPQKVTFDAQLVGDVVVTTEALEPTTTTDVTITVKNTGNSNLYASPETSISVVKNNPFNERSLFYLQSDWDTPSSVVLLEEGERLAVGEEKSLTFKIYVPLYPPNVTENFVLVGPSGDPIKGSEFKISVDVKKLEGTIIEILPTPVGYLNVRKTAGLGEVVTKVAPGERFIVLDSQTGYYKIRANEKEGWVVNTYVKVVQ